MIKYRPLVQKSFLVNIAKSVFGHVNVAKVIKVYQLLLVFMIYLCKLEETPSVRSKDMQHTRL